MGSIGDRSDRSLNFWSSFGEGDMGAKDQPTFVFSLSAIYFVGSMYCGLCLCTAWAKRSKRPYFSVGSVFLILNTLCFATEGAYWVVFAATGGSFHSGVEYMAQIGGLSLYMSVFLLSLYIFDLSRPFTSAEDVRRRGIIRHRIFFGVFAVWLSIDAVFVFEFQTSVAFQICRIGIHCLFCAVPLFWGWLLLRRRMIEREQLVTTTAQRHKALSEVRAVAISGTAYMLLKMSLFGVLYPLKMLDDEMVQLGYIFIIECLTPIGIAGLFTAMNANSGTIGRTRSTAETKAGAAPSESSALLRP